VSDPVRLPWWSAPARRPRLAAALAALAVLVVALSVIEPLPVGVVHDDGMYVMLAKSLATGQGYRWLNIPGSPPATHFPPGYPALLSLLWRMFPVFPGNVIAFKALNALLLALAAAGMSLFANRRLGFSPLAAAIVAVIGCAAIPTLVLSTLVMSEMLFLCMLFPLLLFANRVTEGEAPVWQPAVLGLLVGALVLVRTHGIALAGAVGLVLLLRRRWRPLAAYVAAFAAVAAPWQLWQSHHQGLVPAPLRGNYESYGGWLVRGFASDGLGLASRTLSHTTTELFASVAVMAGAGIPVLLRAIPAFGALLLLGIGLARLWGRSRVTFFFLCAYLTIVLFWPFTPTRFVWGIWPLLTLVVALGVATVWGWRPHAMAWRATRVAGIAVAASVVCGYSIYTTRGYRGHWWSSIPRHAGQVSRPLVRWTLQHTRPTDIVASNAEPLVYLYTGRRSIPITSFSVDEYFAPPSVASRMDALRSIIRSYPVDAVAVMANDSVSAAAIRLASGPAPELVLRDTIPNGLIFARPTPTLR
jgi:hypothetical protein